MATIKPGTPIRRRDNIPEERRTESREQTAEIIEEMWPAEKKQIAKEAGCSRTHVDNVLDIYFEPVAQGVTSDTGVTFGRDGIEIRVSDDIDPEAARWYLKGFLDGAESTGHDGMQAAVDEITGA